MPFALQFQPSSPFEPIPGWGLAAYDNLQIRVGYKAYSTEDTRDQTTNYRMDMTNWMTFGIPQFIGTHVEPATLAEIGMPPPRVTECI